VTEPPRNWDKELSNIDRVIEKQAVGGGAVAPRPAPAALPRGTSADPAPRGSVAITWLWTLFALALGVALAVWPYQHACGLQAFFYVGAAGVTLAVGGLAALSSWANRRGLAHVLSLLVIAWAGIVAAGEILPRIGYAREARVWTCVAPAVTTPTAAPAPQTGAAPAPTPQAQPDSASRVSP
jgi:hypothetical protein